MVLVPTVYEYMYTKRLPTTSGWYLKRHPIFEPKLAFSGRRDNCEGTGRDGTERFGSSANDKSYSSHGSQWAHQPPRRGGAPRKRIVASSTDRLDVGCWVCGRGHRLHASTDDRRLRCAALRCTQQSASAGPIAQAYMCLEAYSIHVGTSTAHTRPCGHRRTQHTVSRDWTPHVRYGTLRYAAPFLHQAAYTYT